jgi:hypothetical protein
MVTHSSVFICWICAQPVHADACRTNEQGKAVHGSCFMLRSTLIDEIALLHRRQLNTQKEAMQHNWTPAESRLAVNRRLARIVKLVRELGELDEWSAQLRLSSANFA